MAWSTPRTFAVSELLTAANMNTYISDNLNYLYTQVAAQFLLSGSGIRPSSTNGCASPLRVEFPTNDVDKGGASFDGTAINLGQWDHPLPADYDGGTITAVFYWYCLNASTNSAKWGLQAQAHGDSDPIDASWGTIQEVADANNANGDQNISAATCSFCQPL